MHVCMNECMYVSMYVSMYLCIYVYINCLGLWGGVLWHTSQKKSKHLRWLLKRRSQVDFNNWLLTDEKFKNGDVSRLLPLSWIEPETEKLKNIFYTIKVTIPMMTYNVWKTAGFSTIPIYSFMICVFSHTHTRQKKKNNPIGSMYAIYGNIYHQYTPNVSIYTIHGSYGTVYDWYSSDYSHLETSQPSCCDSRPSVRRSELCRISCKWTVLEKKKNNIIKMSNIDWHAWMYILYVCIYIHIMWLNHIHLHS